MSAHSPAPWRYGIACGSKRTVDLDYDPKDFNDNPAIYAADGSIVVGDEEYHVFDEPNRVANVRLMLAAPDLLKAAQEAESALHLIYPELHKSSDALGIAYDAVNTLRAVITKATGEPS